MADGLCIAFGAAAGAALGSFAALVADRAPRGEDVVRTRSRCRHCGRAIRAWHLIPVISWILLRGRCADCRGSIGRPALVMELAGLGLGAAIAAGTVNAAAMALALTGLPLPLAAGGVAVAGAHAPRWLIVGALASILPMLIGLFAGLSFFGA